MIGLVDAVMGSQRRAHALVTKFLSQFTNSHGRRQVAANSGWLLFDKLVRALLGLLVGAWVARHLGPTHFGTLAYVLAYVALFQPFASLSADAIVVRNISQEQSSAPVILGGVLMLRMALGTLCWVLAVAIAAVASHGDGTFIILAALVGGVLVFQSADTVDLWFQSQIQSRRTVVAKLVAYGVSNGAKVVLILANAPLLAFAAVTAFEGLACACALILAYKRFPTDRAWTIDKRTMVSILFESGPFMLSGLAIMVYMRVDQIMVKELLGAHELGIYAVALPISQFWQVVPLTIATSVAPFIARQRLSDEIEYRRSMVLAFRAFFYLGVLTALATYAISGWLVPHLFGNAYSEAVRILNVHSISNIFCFLGIAHALWLVNERRFAVRLYGTLLAGISTIGVNLILLPRIGLVGACITAILAQAVAAFLINGLLDRRSFWLQIEAITFRRV